MYQWFKSFLTPVGKEQSFYVKILSARLLIVLLIFSTCRLLFYIFNLSAFLENSPGDIVIAFLYGIRFDIAAIIYINILIIVLHIIPHPYRVKRVYRGITKIIFYVFNTTAIFFSIIDLEYFKFTKKRSTFDLFGMKNDFFPLLPEYLKEFWYLVIILIVLVFLMWFLYRKTEKKQSTVKTNYFVQTLYLIIFGSLLVIGARGGFQLKPVRVMDAVLYSTTQTTPLVLNTPFTMLQTYGRKRLSDVRYMSDDDARKQFIIKHTSHPAKPFNKKNVVIIIVESMSREFMKSYRTGESYTPFLDSLSQSAVVCENSFANGTRSMEAIPAVLASIPHLMQDSYVYSAYQGNRIKSIGSILGKEGYETVFFHGGTNGTMGFDSFIRMAGFEKYYGRTEYNNDKDFDGLWGIYDEEFLQFVAGTLNQTPTPFCAAIFTLSSHHPISIPRKHNGEFDGGSLQIHKGIRYVDYSLRRFFETAAKMNWYTNTLFVITGDHTPDESKEPFYSTQVGVFAVPIIFFEPQLDFPRKIGSIAQHVDIMPSILSRLDYTGDFISFGDNVFDAGRTGYSINFRNGVYQILDGNYFLQFDGKRSVNLFNYRSDKLLKTNIIAAKPDVVDRLQTKLEAIIQIYNHAMINDQLIVPTVQ